MTTKTKPSSTDYSMGYTENFLQLLYRRNADHNAAHLLPHLQPHMEILDLGCGPGVIALDLASKVPYGSVTGLDCDQLQVETARVNAAQRPYSNASFKQGDAAALPFEDNQFDVVHCHAFLMHTPAVRATLQEVLRVLQPGGIISVREMDVPSSYLSPFSPNGPTPFDMLARIIRHTGGNPIMGRHIKTYLSNANFTHLHAGASADFFDTPEDILFLSQLMHHWALSPDMELKAVQMDISTPQDFANWRQQTAKWAKRTSAAGCFYFGHALGTKPC